MMVIIRLSLFLELHHSLYISWPIVFSLEELYCTFLAPTSTWKTLENYNLRTRGNNAAKVADHIFALFAEFLPGSTFSLVSTRA